MTRPAEIPEDIWQQASILMDQHRQIADDLEYTARIIMWLKQQEQPQHPGLTPRMAECFEAISTHQQKFGVSPSVRDLMAEMGLASSSGIVRLLKSLEQRGCIKRLQGRARAITIVGRA